MRCQSAMMVILGAWIAGCPSHTFLSVQDQEKIQTMHREKAFYLKQSCFVGPFFAYDDRMFISERAFDERPLIESPGGDPILPAEPLGVLPMGAKVTVQDIEFPTGSAISSRKLKSPRHFTWIMLQPEGSPHAKPHILVLTQEFRRVTDFEQALKTYLVEADPRQQFASSTAEELEAIDRKTLIKGMQVDAVFRSRGHPDKIHRKMVDGVKVEEWVYAPDRVVVLKDNRVDSWRGFPDFDVEVYRTTGSGAKDQPDSPGQPDETTPAEAPQPGSP